MVYIQRPWSQESDEHINKCEIKGAMKVRQKKDNKKEQRTNGGVLDMVK
jgi:hypothetical protein